MMQDDAGKILPMVTRFNDDGSVDCIPLNQPTFESRALTAYIQSGGKMDDPDPIAKPTKTDRTAQLAKDAPTVLADLVNELLRLGVVRSLELSDNIRKLIDDVARIGRETN
jgi:hypothetical protein